MIDTHRRTPSELVEDRLEPRIEALERGLAEMVAAFAAERDGRPLDSTRHLQKAVAAGVPETDGYGDGEDELP